MDDFALTKNNERVAESTISPKALNFPDFPVHNLQVFFSVYN